MQDDPDRLEKRQPGSVRDLTLFRLAEQLRAVGEGGHVQSDPVDSDAVAWFVRFHCDPVDQFDWSAFEDWIRAQPAHRLAYDRVEQLWYGSPDEPGGLQAPHAFPAPAQRSAQAERQGRGDTSDRVVRLRFAPHAPDQRPVDGRPVFGGDLESEALIEGNVARGRCLQPGGSAEPIQSAGPRL